MSSIRISETLKFFELVGNLKHLKRTGWVRKGIKEPESVAGHMYRMALMSFLFDEKDDINKDKVLKMCLVHDLGESVVGDITPYCGVSVADKHKLEVDAMKKMTGLIGETVGKEIMNLFMEYEDQVTSESHIVKDLDKFDMILQAYEYEKQEAKPKSLEEFFKSTEGKFKYKKVQEWVEQLKKERDGDVS